MPGRLTRLRAALYHGRCACEEARDVMAGKANVRLKIRIEFDGGLILGPGKIDLLEGIRETGSISAAGRRMQMSYKRAWDLVDTMNRLFESAVVHTSKGGSGGGGASLTDFGEAVVTHYRRIEVASLIAADTEICGLQRRLKSHGRAQNTN
jgi:molybdate transport system regulatory protein